MGEPVVLSCLSGQREDPDPEDLAKLLTVHRSLGVRGLQGEGSWEHFLCHMPQPHVYL